MDPGTHRMCFEARLGEWGAAQTRAADMLQRIAVGAAAARPCARVLSTYSPRSFGQTFPTSFAPASGSTIQQEGAGKRSKFAQKFRPKLFTLPPKGGGVSQGNEDTLRACATSRLHVPHPSLVPRSLPALSLSRAAMVLVS